MPLKEKSEQMPQTSVSEILKQLEQVLMFSRILMRDAAKSCVISVACSKTCSRAFSKRSEDDVNASFHDGSDDGVLAADVDA